MARYTTKQRKILLDFLDSHSDQLFTARQLAASLQDSGISTSAVYRNLSQLEAEGSVRKSPGSAARESVYQYTASDKCREHLHMSCTKCGKTLHMEGECAKRLVEQVGDGGFIIDKSSTVIYGVCSNCSENRK